MMTMVNWRNMSRRYRRIALTETDVAESRVSCFVALRASVLHGVLRNCYPNNGAILTFFFIHTEN